MVDYESALALAELSQEEVDAIARHEHMTDTAALEMGNYLCTTPSGERALKRIIVDELNAFRERGDNARGREATPRAQALRRDASAGGVTPGLVGRAAEDR